MAAYPEKHVFNFPGIPSIIGRDLINDLINKARNHGVSFHLGEYTDHIEGQNKDSLLIESNKGEYHSSILIIAAGLKAYFSSLTDFLRIANWNNTCIVENWPSPQAVENKRVAIICGNSREISIPPDISAAAREIKIFIDQQSTQTSINLDDNNIIRKPWTLQSITGNEIPEAVNIVNLSTGQSQVIETDFIIGFFDNHARQTLYSNLGIKTMGQFIEVDQKMQTSLRRVYAIGDIAWYPGKVMLLAAGVQEAKIAIKNGLKIK